MMKLMPTAKFSIIAWVNVLEIGAFYISIHHTLRILSGTKYSCRKPYGLVSDSPKFVAQEQQEVPCCSSFCVGLSESKLSKLVCFYKIKI
jgi:hypothetical protein